jgi:hypothetical protein
MVWSIFDAYVLPVETETHAHGTRTYVNMYGPSTHTHTHTQLSALHKACWRIGLNLIKPQELSNTVWAFNIYTYTHAHTHTQLSALSEACSRIGLNLFKPQELSNTVWAFATAWNLCDHRQIDDLRGVVTNLAMLIESEIIRRGELDEKMRPNHVEESANANKYSAKDPHDDCGTLASFKPQELSNTREFSSPMHPWMCRCAYARDKCGTLASFKPQELSNTRAFSPPMHLYLCSFGSCDHGLQQRGCIHAYMYVCRHTHIYTYIHTHV